MIPIDKIEDALIAEIKASVAGIKTVEVHESHFDERTLAALIPYTPFVLIRYGRLRPVETERGADAGSGVKRRSFFLSIGSKSLRSRKETQRGCYEILNTLRDQFDGGVVTTSEGTVHFALADEDFLFSHSGLIVYGAEYFFYDS